MITLITGVPGSGKTLYAVWLLKKIAKDRRVLVDGIRDLAIEHVEIDEPWLRQWHVNAQAHDLIVIDEAQRIYPPTTASQKPTPDVEQLHVHRHMPRSFLRRCRRPVQCRCRVLCRLMRRTACRADNSLWVGCKRAVMSW
nr:zonular occludens toxin domain-containing protein [Burkholderia pseudomallei]